MSTPSPASPQTLPEPLRLQRPIYAVIRPSGEGFIASFTEANINASGDFQSEALLNLKELIIDLYDELSGEPEDRLGPHPARQRAVLNEFIHRV